MNEIAFLKFFCPGVNCAVSMTLDKLLVVCTSKVKAILEQGAGEHLMA